MFIISGAPVFSRQRFFRRHKSLVKALRCDHRLETFVARFSTLVQQSEAYRSFARKICCSIVDSCGVVWDSSIVYKKDLVLDFRFLSSSLRFIDCLQFPPSSWSAGAPVFTHQRFLRWACKALGRGRRLETFVARFSILCSSLRLIDCLRFPLRGDTRDPRDFGLYSPEIPPSTKVACKKLCGVIIVWKGFCSICDSWAEQSGADGFFIFQQESFLFLAIVELQIRTPDDDCCCKRLWLEEISPSFLHFLLQNLSRMNQFRSLAWTQHQWYTVKILVRVVMRRAQTSKDWSSSSTVSSMFLRKFSASFLCSGCLHIVLNAVAVVWKYFFLDFLILVQQSEACSSIFQ